LINPESGRKGKEVIMKEEWKKKIVELEVRLAKLEATVDKIIARLKRKGK